MSWNRPPRKKAKAKNDGCMLEADEQVKLVVYLRKKGIRHFAVQNGAKRSMWEAAKFKREGGAAGFPDLGIPYARKGHHGLFLELKRVSGGVVSPAQREWIDLLVSNGYLAVVCRGADEAIAIVEKYFDGEPVLQSGGFGANGL